MAQGIRNKRAGIDYMELLERILGGSGKEHRYKLGKALGVPGKAIEVEQVAESGKYLLIAYPAVMIIGPTGRICLFKYSCIFGNNLVSSR